MLMTVIPAQVAGVTHIRVVSPRPAVETMATASFLGVTEFYRVGGAQAVAALAYGTKSIPRVDKIVGPGNLFVTAAKKMVAFDCGIDFLAGPTEVAIVSEAGDPDLLPQIWSPSLNMIPMRWRYSSPQTSNWRKMFCGKHKGGCEQQDCHHIV